MAGVRASEGSVSGSGNLRNAFRVMRLAGGGTDWLCRSGGSLRRGVVDGAPKPSGSVNASTPYTYSDLSNTSGARIRTSTYNKWDGLEL